MSVHHSFANGNALFASSCIIYSHDYTQDYQCDLTKCCKKILPWSFLVCFLVLVALTWALNRHVFVWAMLHMHCHISSVFAFVLYLQNVLETCEWGLASDIVSRSRWALVGSCCLNTHHDCSYVMLAGRSWIVVSLWEWSRSTTSTYNWCSYAWVWMIGPMCGVGAQRAVSWGSACTWCVCSGVVAGGMLTMNALICREFYSSYSDVLCRRLSCWSPGFLVLMCPGQGSGRAWKGR
jgi:hypothetical protein